MLILCVDQQLEPTYISPTREPALERIAEEDVDMDANLREEIEPEQPVASPKMANPDETVVQEIDMDDTVANSGGVSGAMGRKANGDLGEWCGIQLRIGMLTTRMIAS